MKFKFGLLAVVIGATVVHSVNAMENEPDGFRGVQWGTSTKSVKGLIETPDADLMQRFIGQQVGLNLRFPIKSYIRSDDKREFNGVPMGTTIYTFYKDQFVGVVMRYQSTIDIHPLLGQQYPDYQNQGKVEATLKQYFGPTDLSKMSFMEILKSPRKDRPAYEGEKTGIISKCMVINQKSNSTRSNCELQFKSVVLGNQVKQDW